MENAEDDPREYQQSGGMDEAYPPGMEHFLRECDSIAALTRSR